MSLELWMRNAVPKWHLCRNKRVLLTNLQFSAVWTTQYCLLLCYVCKTPNTVLFEMATPLWLTVPFWVGFGIGVAVGWATMTAAYELYLHVRRPNADD